MARRSVAPEETSAPVTPSAARGLGMHPHDHRDASLALSVTSAILLRSAAKRPNGQEGCRDLRFAPEQHGSEGISPS